MLKKFFVYIAVALPAAVFAQSAEPFTISGKLNTVKEPLKAYLSYQTGATRVLDSTVLSDGSFQFKGKVLNPVGALMLVDHRGTGFSGFNKTDDVLSFYVEKGTIYLNGADSIAQAKITGTPVNTDNEELTGMLSSLYEKAQKLYAEAQTATRDQQQSPVFQNTLQDKFKLMQKERENVLKGFITSHPYSYLSLMAVSSMGGPAADVNVIEPLYDGLAQNLKDTEPGKQLKQSFAALKATSIGVTAPDFTQNDVNGKPVKLSSLRGQYVLLDFWASWCGPCRQENPNVVRVYNKYKNRKFTVLGVSLDKTTGRADWLKAIQDDGLTWTHVSDLKFWNNEAATMYFVQSIPQNYLIDPQGKIVAKNLRGADLEGKLIEFLGK